MVKLLAVPAAALAAATGFAFSHHAAQPAGPAPCANWQVAQGKDIAGGNWRFVPQMTVCLPGLKPGGWYFCRDAAGAPWIGDGAARLNCQPESGPREF